MIEIYKGVKSVYLIRCLPTGESYIGSTICSSSRWYGHISKLNINQHENKKMQAVFNKYGKSAFVFGVIKEIHNDCDLKIEEKKAILLMKPDFNVKYNSGEEAKRVYTYRIEPSIQRKAFKKAKKQGKTLSSIAAELLTEYSSK